jgi:DNA polymerase III sliding clamp (beta) subunit (PCNA family)
MTQTTIRLPKSGLGLVAFADANDAQLNLCGVYICPKPDNRYDMVATDGHRMAVITFVAESGIPAHIVPRDVVEKMLRFAPYKRKGDCMDIMLTYDRNTSTYALQAGGSVLTYRQVYGNYPDYSQIMEQRQKNVTNPNVGHGKALFAVNLAYVGDLAAYLKKYANNTQAQVWAVDSFSPVFFTAPVHNPVVDCVDFAACIMPCRV